MGMTVWIDWDSTLERYYILDFRTPTAAGPIEISNELFERFMEHDRQDEVFQSMMDTLVYDWTYPDEEDEVDCD